MQSQQQESGLALPGPLFRAFRSARGHVDRLGSRARAVLVRQDVPSEDEGFSMGFTDDRPVSVLVPMRGGIGFAAAIPGESVAGSVVTQGISSTLSLYQTALIVRLILTWFPSPPQALAGPLSTICDPYLNLFRGIIPPLGGIDLSPILAFVALDLLTGSASSLGAEVPEGAAVYGTSAAQKRRSRFGNGRPKPDRSSHKGKDTAQ